MKRVTRLTPLGLSMKDFTFNSKLVWAQLQQERATLRRQLENETDPQKRAELHEKLTGSDQWRA